jgi:hypothetical protein
VLQIFITLKNPSPWLGLNPQPLGPVASTLTTTPPWQYHTFTCIYSEELKNSNCPLQNNLGEAFKLIIREKEMNEVLMTVVL